MVHVMSDLFNIYMNNELLLLEIHSIQHISINYEY